MRIIGSGIKIATTALYLLAVGDFLLLIPIEKKKLAYCANPIAHNTIKCLLPNDEEVVALGMGILLGLLAIMCSIFIIATILKHHQNINEGVY